MKNLLIYFCVGALVDTAILPARAADKEPVTEKRVNLKWPNGKPFQEETYRIDAGGKAVQHGPATSYFQNGKPHIQVEYANGKRNGLFTEYASEGGHKTREGAFKDGLETGKWTWWQESTGALKSECTYKDGKIVGKKVSWMNGKVVVEEGYNDAGELVEYTSWHLTGKADKEPMAKHGTFKGGKKDGKWTYWNQDGTIKAEGEWQNGKPWSGKCGVPVAGDAGSWGGLETFSEYKEGRKVEGK